MEAISNQELVENYIYPNMDLNYYWSDSFDPLFYVCLAKAGFISTSMYDSNDNAILLPEIQFEYAILDFKDLHIGKNVNKLLKQNNYEFKINTSFNKILKKIHAYHDMPWLNKEYQHMLKEIQKNSYDNFELMCVELFNTEGKLIAGEIGYTIGRTYTSLTGFFKREKAYNNWGKLQLILLSNYLESHHFDFWNLGHASLQYKLDLGAKIYSRKKFLKRWKKSALL